MVEINNNKVFVHCELCGKQIDLGTVEEFNQNVEKYNVDVKSAKWFCCDEHEELYCEVS